MSETYNTFDLIFIAFSLIFVVVAFFRGFIKEIFSLLIWIIALSVSYFGAPFLAKALSSYSSNKMVLDVTARIILFIISFFALLFSTSSLSDDLKDKMPLILDRSMGVLYGIGKTLLIFGAFYAITANLYLFLLGKDHDADGKKVPSWLSDAKCGNILRIAGEAIDPAVEAFISAITKNLNKSGYIPKSIDPSSLDSKINEVLEEDKKTNSTTDMAKKQNHENQSPNQIEKETGYDKKNIDKLGRLIDVINKSNN